MNAPRPKVECWVREAREHAGLTVTELARRAGISRRGLQFMEDGTYLPTIGTALALSRALGIGVEELFTLNELPADPGAAQAIRDPQVAAMAARYEAGATLAEVGKELGISGETVRRKLIRAGVTMRRAVDTRQRKVPMPSTEPASVVANHTHEYRVGGALVTEPCRIPDSCSSQTPGVEPRSVAPDAYTRTAVALGEQRDV